MFFNKKGDGSGEWLVCSGGCHRRHPRDGGDPLRSGCFLHLILIHLCYRVAQPRHANKEYMKLDCHANWRLLAMTKEYMKHWIPAQHHPQKFSIFAGPEAGMTVLKEIKN